MKNVNKLIDYIENEDLILSIVGNCHIDDDSNIGSDDESLIDFSSFFYSLGFNGVLLLSNFSSYNDIEKFISFAKINGSDKWRIPTEKEVEVILEELGDSKVWREYPIYYYFLSENTTDDDITIGTCLNLGYSSSTVGTKASKFEKSCYSKEDKSGAFFIVC